MAGREAGGGWVGQELLGRDTGTAVVCGGVPTEP